MNFTVEKEIIFNTKGWAGDIIDCLYDMLENGHQDEDWKCLNDEQQVALVEEILTEAIRQVKEG